MPDLEQKILAWRRQMLAAGITATSLTELENHLREDVERQLRLGVEINDAFNHATKTMGSAVALKKEFQKEERSWATTLVSLIGVAFLIVAGLFSLIILPKFFHQSVGWMPKLIALAIVALSVSSWRSGYKLLPAIGNARLRALAGFVSCLLAMIWMRCFVLYLLPQIVIGMIGQDQFLGWYFLSFLGGFATVAILGGIGHGLEKAAREAGPVTD